MSHADTGMRVAGAWLALAAIILSRRRLSFTVRWRRTTACRCGVSPMGALRWAVVHWAAAAALSFFAIASLIALTAGSRAHAGMGHPVRVGAAAGRGALDGDHGRGGGHRDLQCRSHRQPCRLRILVDVRGRQRQWLRRHGIGVHRDRRQRGTDGGRHHAGCGRHRLLPSPVCLPSQAGRWECGLGCPSALRFGSWARS